MSCSRFRTVISARIDGEPPPPEESPGPSTVDEAQLDAHLASCAACRTFAHAAAGLRRSVRLTPAPDVPDLTPAILAAIGAERASASGAGAGRMLRVVLTAIAVVQIAVALPALLLGNDAGLPVHTARHLGSFDVALGVGFLFAAFRPARIAGILPVVAALACCLLASSLLDVVSGATGAAGEAHHALAFAGLVVVWMLGRAAVVRDGGGAAGRVQAA